MAAGLSLRSNRRRQQEDDEEDSGCELLQDQDLILDLGRIVVGVVHGSTPCWWVKNSFLLWGLIVSCYTYHALPSAVKIPLPRMGKKFIRLI
jgi:hypothetical protein